MQKYEKNGNYASLPIETSSLLLDTLAQLDGPQPEKNVSSLKKRSYAKYLTNQNLFPLVDLESSLKKAYWNSFHCSNVLLQHGKTITGKYCNNRWCLVCNRIRTAKLINGYLPVINSEIKEPMFTTLTIPNISGEDLRSTIHKMIFAFNKLNRYLRDHHKGIKGVRKIEVTYSLKLKNYHPHFHLLIDGKQRAEEVVSIWLSYFTEADRRGQDVRPADQNSLIELFKYSTKMTTETGNAMMPPVALDTIFKALYKIRTYQPIGINKILPNEDIDELQAEQIEELKSAIDVWTWEQELKDWLNADGEFLTEYVEHNSEKHEQNKKSSHIRRRRNCLSG